VFTYSPHTPSTIARDQATRAVAIMHLNIYIIVHITAQSIVTVIVILPFRINVIAFHIAVAIA
jgi:hypothetical protein